MLQEKQSSPTTAMISSERNYLGNFVRFKLEAYLYGTFSIHYDAGH